MPDSKLPVPRVEVVSSRPVGSIIWLRPNTSMCASVGLYGDKAIAISDAEKWSAETGWPLVINGKVVDDDN